MAGRVPGPTAGIQFFNGEQLKAAREKLEWTRELLAVEAGVSYAHVLSLETGWRSPSVEMIEKLATALGVEVSDLFAPDEAIQANVRTLFGPNGDGGPYRDDIAAVGEQIVSEGVKPDELRAWCQKRGLPYDKVRAAANAAHRNRRAAANGGA